MSRGLIGISIAFACCIATARILVPVATVVPMPDPEAEQCDDCQLKTAPEAMSGEQGHVRWYSDADARDPARTDPFTDSHCFVRSVRNKSAGPADYRWDIAGLQNARLLPGLPDKRCDGLGGVGNPPAKGPFKVNFLPDVTSEVWRPVTQMASDMKFESFAERKTTIETSLSLDPARPQRLKLSLASSVSRTKELFHYSYSITRHTDITLPYVLTWSATRSAAFTGALKERDLSPQFELPKLGSIPITIEFTTNGPPELVESYMELTPTGGKTTFLATVEAWIPPGGRNPRILTIPRDP